ncbi:M15 family metallopeptidase [uncultured Desulfobacter sp.]|uniref:M15 family metallopeptidase n=1 Tax=uncultured Desulfobacter sp. TaxID=240139 RepID=UPI002AA75067|nr:M15 family metallopeptidase [uncultured Desulfobacter sp.]
MPHQNYNGHASVDRRTFLKLAGSAILSGTYLPLSSGLKTAWALEASQCQSHAPDQGVKDALVGARELTRDPKFLKIRFFDRDFKDDVFLPDNEMPLLLSIHLRFKRIQKQIGHANFCLAGFDDALTCARTYGNIGAFSSRELDFLEKLFHRSAGDYGFMGKRTIPRLTWQVPSGDTVKIQGSGNYLYKGKSQALYQDIRKKIGTEAVLTSGIRGVSKQFLLFLNKAVKSRGNLSMASRSLAPPGYSFHATGDFDMGEKGFGVDNFTEKFTRTRVYSRLSSLGYIRFRYGPKNHLGVRYEPWHVEVGG